MKDTDQIMESVGETIGYLQQYLEQQVAYYRLETAERVSMVVSSIVTMFVLFALASMVVTFGTLAIAIYLGSVLGSYALSFGLVTLFYFALGVIVFLVRRTMITNPIITKVIHEIYKPKEETPEEKKKVKTHTPAVGATTVPIVKETTTTSAI